MPETVDVAIIGGGMAGLTAGAVLARSGLKVALFEKHGKLGGYAQYFGQEPTFDAATHLIGGCGPRGWTTAALREIGVEEKVELLPLDPVYRAVWPGHDYLASADPERFRQELSTLWPTESNGLRRIFADLDAMGADYLSQTGELLEKNAHRTLESFLSDYTKNEELQAALSALWLFTGLPPSRVSAAYYASLWHSFHTQGSAAVKGGVKALTTAMAEVITGAGGTIENRSAVKQIVRNRGRISGVKLEDGREFAAKAVISTANPHDTFEELLASEGQAPAGYPALRSGFVASISAMQVHLVVDGALEAPAHTTLLHSTYDLADAYLDLQREEPRYSAMACTWLDREDTDRCPPGKHMLSLFTLAPYSRGDNWEAPFDMRRGPLYRTRQEYLDRKEPLADAMVERAEQVFPGILGRVEKRKVGTPITLERYTFNTGGAAFGWANLPEQTGANRPGAKTPFTGLYMAGHWTFPGGTIAGAVVSGQLAARAVLEES